MVQVNPNAEKIQKAIREIVHHFDKIEIENDGVKEILKELKEEIGVKPSIIRRVARAISKGNTGETVTEATELADLIESLTR